MPRDSPGYGLPSVYDAESQPATHPAAVVPEHYVQISDSMPVKPVVQDSGSVCSVRERRASVARLRSIAAAWGVFGVVGGLWSGG